MMLDALGCSPLDTARSPKWAALEHEYKREHPNCENCGATPEDSERLGFTIAVHHKRPVHVYPHLELVKSNLKTLCEKQSMNCHLWMGHDGKWASWSDTVDDDCTAFLKRIENRP